MAALGAPSSPAAPPNTGCRPSRRRPQSARRPRQTPRSRQAHPPAALAIAGALARYRQAISADDTYALAHLNVALALQDLFNERRGDLSPEEQHNALAEMSVHLKTALRLDERLIPGLRALGYVERAQGHFEEARDAFERYLELSDPKDPQRERVQNMLAEVAERAAVETALAAAVAVAEHVHDADATAPKPNRRSSVSWRRSRSARKPGGRWVSFGVLPRIPGPGTTWSRR